MKSSTGIFNICYHYHLECKTFKMVKLRKDNYLPFLWLYKDVNMLESHKYYYIMTKDIK